MSCQRAQVPWPWKNRQMFFSLAMRTKNRVVVKTARNRSIWLLCWQNRNSLRDKDFFSFWNTMFHTGFIKAISWLFIFCNIKSTVFFFQGVSCYLTFRRIFTKPSGGTHRWVSADCPVVREWRQLSSKEAWIQGEQNLFSKKKKNCLPWTTHNNDAVTDGRPMKMTIISINPTAI